MNTTMKEKTIVFTKYQLYTSYVSFLTFLFYGPELPIRIYLMNIQICSGNRSFNFL